MQVRVRGNKALLSQANFIHSYEEKIGNMTNQNPEYPLKATYIFKIHIYCQHQDFGEPLSLLLLLSYSFYLATSDFSKINLWHSCLCLESKFYTCDLKTEKIGNANELTCQGQR